MKTPEIAPKTSSVACRNWLPERMVDLFGGGRGKPGARGGEGGGVVLFSKIFFIL